MDYSEEKFKEHLQKVVSANEINSDRPLSRKELKELALSMGLGESEWENLMLQAVDLLNQAVNHLKVQNYADAIQSAEEATAIDPYIKDGNAILAQSYYRLGLLEKNQEYIAKAEQAARMELRNDPLDSTATNVLGAIESQKSEGKHSKGLAVKIAIACAFVGVLFLILYMCNNSSQQKNVSTIIDEQRTQNDVTTSQVESAKRKWENAIERRNNNLLTLVPANAELEKELDEKISNYSYSKKTEQEIQKLIGKIKAQGDLNQDQIAALDGDANRISVEFSRYIEAISAYNSVIDRNGKGKGTKINFPE